MAGIYVHIPYCKQKCSYCNFFTVVSLKTKDAFLKALLKEIELGHDYLGEKHLDSVYFGGGTPSILDAGEINAILDKLAGYFVFGDKIEITLEANPDDINRDFLKELVDAGINRLSLGVQSFFDSELALLRRSHDRATALRAIEDIKETGLSNTNVDLIFGIPGSDMDRWKRNLDVFLSTGTAHLSCYSLTVEPGTILQHDIKKGRVPVPPDDFAAEAFMYAHSLLQDQGYEHYEISNYARDGQYAVHNTNYWCGAHYWGLGPAAHSYNGEQRQWNIANVRKYIAAISNDIIPAQKEILTLTDKYNEYIMTGMRTMWGVDENKIREFGPPFLKHFKKEIKKYMETGQVKNNDKIYSLSSAGMLFADKIIAGLFV